MLSIWALLHCENGLLGKDNWQEFCWLRSSSAPWSTSETRKALCMLCARDCYRKDWLCVVFYGWWCVCTGEWKGHREGAYKKVLPRDHVFDEMTFDVWMRKWWWKPPKLIQPVQPSLGVWVFIWRYLIMPLNDNVLCVCLQSVWTGFLGLLPSVYRTRLIWA